MISNLVRIDRAMTCDKFTATQAKVMYGVIGYVGQESGVCWPSVNKIADSIKLSRRTVQRELKRLRDMGSVEILARSRDNGSQTSNLYKVNDNWDGWNAKVVTPPVTDQVPAPVTNQVPLEPNYKEQDKENKDIYIKELAEKIYQAYPKCRRMLAKRSKMEITASIKRVAKEKKMKPDEVYEWFLKVLKVYEANTNPKYIHRSYNFFSPKNEVYNDVDMNSESTVDLEELTRELMAQENQHGVD